MQGSVTGGRGCVSLLGLLLGLGLLIWMTLRGASLFIATPLCALVVALTSGLPLLARWRRKVRPT